jgi:hypothetical protein
MDRLSQLAMKHGCNKCPEWGGAGHSYTPFYDELFRGRKVRRLLEIGIWQGASLRMWEEYFPDAEIVGIDINPANLIWSGRIHSYQCDQNDEQALHDLMWDVVRPDGTPTSTLASHDGFDVIIDDGSHRAAHQIASANTLLPLLSWRGIYVIEDVQRENIEKVRAGIGCPSHVVEFADSRVTSDNDRLITIEWPMPISNFDPIRGTFCDRGHVWVCGYDKASSHFVGTLSNPTMRICTESWEDLKAELRAVDLSTSRIDAVALAKLA